jgi:hypothetical protein
MTSMRPQTDTRTRDARRNSMARADDARNELDPQLHQRAVHGEVMGLANNPFLLAKASAVRSATEPNTEEEGPAAQEEKKPQLHRK